MEFCYCCDCHRTRNTVGFDKGDPVLECGHIKRVTEEDEIVRKEVEKIMEDALMAHAKSQGLTREALIYRINH